MPLLSHFAAFVFLCALSLFPASLQALTVLGTGTGALLGGDLTDPEDDGNDGNGSGFNWLSTAASSENNFGGEGALDVFDNQVGSGNTKWCCNAPPQWVAVQLDKPYVLTHFTLAAGNDVPSRDPNIWSIEGSNDGTNWTPIYQWTSGVSPFSNRLEVIRFDGNGQDFASPAPFSWFRYRVTSTDSGHQLNELELFGVPVVVFNDFSIDKPLIPTGEPITLSWDLDPGVTSISIDNGVGDVTAQTFNGIGQITLNPGPGSNTTYTMTAIHPESTAQQSVHVTVTNQPIINSFAATPAVIAPGGSTTLRWDVFNISSLDLNGSDVTGQTSLAVSPASTTVYTLTASNPNGSDVANLNVTVVVPGEPIISEFMASNGGASIVDEDGDSSDWIEIHNPSGNIAMLDGYYLTDDPGDLQKWAFPAVNLAPLDYLIVFASGKDRVNPASELHTNFNLDANGEYLALVNPDGVTIVSEFGPAGTDYPEQEADLSFGNFGNPPQPGYFDTATPGAANNVGFLGFVADTKFDLNRGFYNSPQSVTISTATPGASIRYTTDGSWPSETSGTLYSGPVLINRTTPLRAIAYKASHRPTNVDTHTYIFVDDIITQRSSTTQSIWGFPSSWDGNSVDYGMNSSVVSLHNRTIRNDLKTVPTLSIAMDSDDLFGSRGVYSHPQNSGVSWERATSLELIDPANPDGSSDFQHNCGIRIQGGAFRSFGLTRKKSFRVLFKDIYGTSKLRYPFFGPTAAQQFDTLIFRMESNDGYQWGNRTNVQYARDEFGRRSQLAMGSPSPTAASCTSTSMASTGDSTTWSNGPTTLWAKTISAPARKTGMASTPAMPPTREAPPPGTGSRAWQAVFPTRAVSPPALPSTWKPRASIPTAPTTRQRPTTSTSTTTSITSSSTGTWAITTGPTRTTTMVANVTFSTTRPSPAPVAAAERTFSAGTPNGPSFSIQAATRPVRPPGWPSPTETSAAAGNSACASGTGPTAPSSTTAP